MQDGFGKIAVNGSELFEIAVNRRWKFRFRRHVAKANFIGFCVLRSRKFQLNLTPSFFKTLLCDRPCFKSVISVNSKRQSHFHNLTFYMQFKLGFYLFNFFNSSKIASPTPFADCGFCPVTTR